jgi:rRNA-processing protein FCF1
LSSVIASSIHNNFELKKYLREENFNKIQNMLMIKNRDNSNIQEQNFEFATIIESVQNLKLKVIDYEDSIYSSLTKPICYFIYTNGNPLKQMYFALKIPIG